MSNNQYIFHISKKKTIIGHMLRENFQTVEVVLGYKKVENGCDSR